MLPGFQQYLVDKGFKRTYIEYHNRKAIEIEDYKKEFLSGYGPTHYNYRKDNLCCWYGLAEMGKPPVMCLGSNKIKIVTDVFKTFEDGYRILFSNWKEDKFDLIYDVFISDDKYFLVDCSNEKDVKIKIFNKS